MRGGLRLAALLLSAGAVSAPVVGAAQTPASEWKIEQRSDRIAGAAARTAVLLTRAENARAANTRPFLIKFAALQLMCFRNGPIVRFAFNFRVGANRSASVEYRFDDRPEREANARFLSDFRTVIIEDKDAVREFVASLAASGRLHLRVSSLIVGQTNAEFRTAGAPPAIAAAYATCPLPPAARRRTP